MAKIKVNGKDYDRNDINGRISLLNNSINGLKNEIIPKFKASKTSQIKEAQSQLKNEQLELKQLIKARQNLNVLEKDEINKQLNAMDKAIQESKDFIKQQKNSGVSDNQLSFANKILNSQIESKNTWMSQNGITSALSRGTGSTSTGKTKKGM